MTGLTHAQADQVLSLFFGFMIVCAIGTAWLGWLIVHKPRHAIKSDARRVDRPVPSMRCMDERQLARALDALDLRRLRDEQERIECEQRKFRLIIGGSTRERIH